MTSTYQHIVLGVGGIGGAAAYWLARRGDGDVLAIEQYRLGHDRGASENHSRIIRHSYHTTEYTSLTRAAYEHMRALEQETGLELLRITTLSSCSTGSIGRTSLRRNGASRT